MNIKKSTLGANFQIHIHIYVFYSNISIFLSTSLSFNFSVMFLRFWNKKETANLYEVPGRQSDWKRKYLKFMTTRWTSGMHSKRENYEMRTLLIANILQEMNQWMTSFLVSFWRKDSWKKNVQGCSGYDCSGRRNDLQHLLWEVNFFICFKCW